MGVKVTDVPAQIVVEDAAMLNEGVTLGFTVIVTEFEVAVVGETQAAFDVITHETTAPFVKEVVVKVAPVAVLTPFTFH